MAYLKVPSDREMDDIVTRLWKHYPIDDFTLQEVKEKLRLKRHNQQLDGHYMWIGINPCKVDQPNTTYSTMLSLYQYFKSVSPYKDIIWCVEGHTENGYRPHIHALVKCNGNTRTGYQIKRLARLFDIEPNYIDIKISKETSLNTQRLQYIKGDKREEKLIYVEKDIAEREECNIPHYITL